MSEHSSATAEAVPADADVCPADERRAHRELLYRHPGFLIDVLAGEQQQRQWVTPCGCPDATPETLARTRSSSSSSFPCTYEDICTPGAGPSDDGGCPCGDPLCGSDDPLDAVAAAAISDASSAVWLYYTRGERKLIAGLRRELGSWTEIAAADTGTLCDVVSATAGKYTLDDAGATRLQSLLTAVGEHRYTDDVTLRNLPATTYERLEKMLVSFPGIGDGGARWLLLTALDKPVWPASDEFDALLEELGLLSPGQEPVSGRHRELEERLSSRRIPALHRALAGHARYCSGSHIASDCEIEPFTVTYRLHRQECVTGEDAPTIVDLFCGAGGLSHGFTQGVSSPRFDVALAVDSDQDAIDTYRLNHPEVPHGRIQCADIGDIADSPAAFEHLASDVDIVIGGPPCQALSVAGYRSRLADDDTYSVLGDPRTGLYRHYVSFLETLQPQYIIMENVEGILSPLGEDDRRVIDDVVAALAGAGYTAEYRLLDCSTFGIPQNRERVVVFGARNDAVPDPAGTVENFFEDVVPTAAADTTTKQALTNLPRLRRGEGGDVVAGRNRGRASDFVREHNLLEETRLTYNHQAREHPMEKDRTLFDEVMEPGDTGWDVKYQTKYGHLIEYNVGTEENPAFKDKYRMLQWDQPAPTVVAHLAKDANSFILPDYYEYARPDPSKQDTERNRGITPREAARLQSFPDSYIFLGPFVSQFRQIGNAVPPVLGDRVAEILAEYIAASPDEVPSTMDPVATATDD